MIHHDFGEYIVFACVCLFCFLVLVATCHRLTLQVDRACTVSHFVQTFVHPQKNAAQYAWSWASSQNSRGAWMSNGNAREHKTQLLFLYCCFKNYEKLGPARGAGHQVQTRIHPHLSYRPWRVRGARPGYGQTCAQSNYRDLKKKDNTMIKM